MFKRQKNEILKLVTGILVRISNFCFYLFQISKWFHNMFQQRCSTDWKMTTTKMTSKEGRKGLCECQLPTNDCNWLLSSKKPKTIFYNYNCDLRIHFARFSFTSACCTPMLPKGNVEFQPSLPISSLWNRRGNDSTDAVLCPTELWVVSVCARLHGKTRPVVAKWRLECVIAKKRALLVRLCSAWRPWGHVRSNWRTFPVVWIRSVWRTFFEFMRNSRKWS